jgi:hypothetical protein
MFAVAPALALPVVTMPAWAPLAMTAVGLGGTYLTNKDKIDRQLERIATLGGMIPSFTGNRADTNIQWRDGTVTDTNGVVIAQPPTTTTVPIDDTPVVATVPSVETDLGNIGITPPPRKPDDPFEKGKRSAAVGEIIGKGIEAGVQDEETPVVVESDKPVGEKVDDFLSEKDAWLAKTANSPAAQAGIDPDARWNQQLMHRDFIKHRNAGTLGEFAAMYPNSQTARKMRTNKSFRFRHTGSVKPWNPSVADKVDEFLETVPAPTNPIEVQFGGDNESSTEATNPIEIQLGGNTPTTEEPVKKTAQQIIEEEKKRRLEKIMSDNFLPNIK